MKQIVTLIKRSFTLMVVSVQLVVLAGFSFSPLALADDTSTSSSGAVVSSSSCPEVNGTNAPTGSAAHTFSFNAATCLWENDYYTWDPVTKVYSPTYSQTPVFNAGTNAWEHTEWNYSPAAGKYVASLISVPAAPTSAAALATPAPTATSTSSSAYGSGGAQSTWTDTATVSNTGADSTNTIVDNSTTNADITINNIASILTTLDANATSGDAFVLNNTHGGNATSGDASNVANLLNMLNSSWDPLASRMATFMADLYGNYSGDLLFNPASVLQTGASSNNTITDNSTSDLTVTINEQGTIVNDIDLSSLSGNATVSGNTYGGNALTGDAVAVANIFNMINSAINTGGSFFGTINLHGNLDGDILLPPGLLAELGQTGANSLNAITDNSQTNLTADLTNNSAITNNLNLLAQSGAAVVDGNTHGGDAITGSADTSVAELNLIGKNVTGKKGLLVFVNVAGLWHGLLLGGLSGPTSILGTGANSTNTITDNSVTDAAITVNRDNRIINNLNLSAITGDATVSGNTHGGNARTGDAASVVNLLNMIDSQLSFSDWFGALFINVLGSWKGSFGVNTSAGGSGGKGSTAAPNTGSSTAPSVTVSTLAHSAGLNSGTAKVAYAYTGTSGGNNDAATNVVSEQTTGTEEQIAASPLEASVPATDSNVGYWILVSGALLFVILSFNGERVVRIIRRLF